MFLMTLSAALLSGCRSPKESAGPSGDSAGTSADTSDSDSSATDTAPFTGLPWEAEGFWTDPGPLEGLLYPTEYPFGGSPIWNLRFATSPDGVSWTADPRVIATGLSSLNLLVVETEDGPGVVITAVLDGRSAEYFGIPYGLKTIYGVASRDLQTWSTFGLPIADADYDYVIDPALWFDRTGALQAVWYGVADHDADPAQIPGPHPILGAPWSMGAFQQRPEPILAIEGTADPVICPMDGEDWLFTTQDALRVIAARGTDSAVQAERFEPVEGFAWEYVTVPWCRSAGADTLLIGQSSGGVAPPSQLLVHPDGSAAQQPPVYSASPFEPANCTSPAVAQVGDQWLLICAVDVLQGQ